MKRVPKIAGAGDLADYSKGQRVMTREGVPGVIDDIHEGPGDLTTYWVTLDNGMGGGEYAEGEIWPDTSTRAATNAARIDASVTHTAADDYPELGTILTDRLPPEITRTAGTKTPGLFHGSLNEAAEHLALTLPLKTPEETREVDGTPADPEEERGYRDGFEDGKAGTTRNFQEPTSEGYRAGYDRGWAFGVQTSRQPAYTLDLDEDRELEESQTAGIEPIQSGLISDVITGAQPDAKYDGFLSYDWCRYRRDNRCFYSKNLDVDASQQAGYAVWTPEDRGNCPRHKWEDQQACPLALPGPNVGGGYTDATQSWEEGGQHDGAPSGMYRAASLDPSLAFHLTATWSDVREKAKRIRAAGGVRLVAARDGVVVGHVRGDTNVYESEIVKVPGRQSIGSWACGCKWGSYSWGRSGPWKRFEGRMCSHVLALQYEVQSRGAFGRSLTLDEKQPSWMDPSLPVRTPGSYDRDKGRYSSLTEHLGMRPVEDQVDSAPIVAMVSAMQAEGARYAEIREFAQAAGVTDVPGLVRQARKTKSFPAKVRGLIRSLFINDDGDIIDETNGSAVAVRDILFPNWDPVKGLHDFRPTTAAKDSGCCSGSCSCGSAAQHTASPADVLMTAQSLEEAAKKLVALARQQEPHTTTLLQGLAKQHDGKLEGLDHRIKGEGSLLRKMKAEASAYASPGDCALHMSDPLRYTMTFSPDEYTQSVKDVVSSLQGHGYDTRVKNYWQRGDAYNGINVALTDPDGFPVELQFHTDESLRVKEGRVHAIYEKWREEPDENKRAIMGHQMRDLYDAVPRPANVLGIQNLKKQPMVPYHQVQWFPHAASVIVGALDPYHPFRYLLLDTGQVLRWHDASVDMWVDGMWVHSPEHARYPFLGEPRSEEISLDEANSITTGEPVYDSDTFAWAGSNGGYAEADLHDEPEPALPSTDGADDELDRAAVLLSQAVAPAQGSIYHAASVDGMSIDEPVGQSDKARAAALVAQYDAWVETGVGENPFAHLGGGETVDSEISLAAQQHLAKEAVRTFSPAEKQAYIDEGEDTEAGNLDRLDISGTHYEALEASISRSAASEDEDLWMLDGDPNG